MAIQYSSSHAHMCFEASSREFSKSTMSHNSKGHGASLSATKFCTFMFLVFNYPHDLTSLCCTLGLEICRCTNKRSWAVDRDVFFLFATTVAAIWIVVKGCINVIPRHTWPSWPDIHDHRLSFSVTSGSWPCFAVVVAAIVGVSVGALRRRPMRMTTLALSE